MNKKGYASVMNEASQAFFEMDGIADKDGNVLIGSPFLFGVAVGLDTASMILDDDQYMSPKLLEDALIHATIEGSAGWPDRITKKVKADVEEAC